MIRWRARSGRAGQSVLEYAVLLGVVVAVIIAGQIYFKRGVQGRWKEASDQIGEQFTTSQQHSLETVQLSSRKETTGISGDGIGVKAGVWSESTILAGMPTAMTETQVGGIATYKKHETTSKDFVTPAIRGDNTKLGDHGEFDSGPLSAIGMFDDD